MNTSLRSEYHLICCAIKNFNKYIIAFQFENWNTKCKIYKIFDEYGQICGLVTIEDILEELVGEIEDQHDIDDLDLIQVSEKEFIADAKIEIDEFEEKFEINLNESSVETLGGYMTKKLGILPKVGDKIIVESIELVVTAADKRRIKKIGISIIS